MPLKLNQKLAAVVLLPPSVAAGLSFFTFDALRRERMLSEEIVASMQGGARVGDLT